MNMSNVAENSLLAPEAEGQQINALFEEVPIYIQRPVLLPVKVCCTLMIDQRPPPEPTKGS